MREIHKHDIGTLFKVRCLDEGGEFDPSGALEKKLIFVWEGGSRVEVAADVLVGTGQQAGQYFLTYLTVDASFLATVGAFRMQGYVLYSGGNQWHSDIIEEEIDGSPLRVYDNL